jgi:hypothetical protein
VYNILPKKNNFDSLNVDSLYISFFLSPTVIKEHCSKMSVLPPDAASMKKQKQIKQTKMDKGKQKRTKADIGQPTNFEYISGSNKQIQDIFKLAGVTKKDLARPESRAIIDNFIQVHLGWEPIEGESNEKPPLETIREVSKVKSVRPKEPPPPPPTRKIELLKNGSAEVIALIWLFDKLSKILFSQVAIPYWMSCPTASPTIIEKSPPGTTAYRRNPSSTAHRRNPPSTAYKWNPSCSAYRRNPPTTAYRRNPSSTASNVWSTFKS